MVSVVNPEGEAQREIAFLQRRIQEAQSQPGRKGVEKRAQIPSIQARIRELELQLGSGRVTDPSIVRKAEVRASGSVTSRAPKGTLSAQPGRSSSVGVRASVLP